VPEPKQDRLRAMELELSRAALALEDLSSARGRPPAGRLDVRRIEQVDVAELVADSVLAWGDVAAERGVALHLAAGEPRLYVIGERVRLAQAVGNLIANAIEHGEGGVEVSLRSERGMVRIEVLDHGPGLPAPLDELRRRRRGRWRGGWAERGHGLAIVNQVAAAHRGRVASAPSRRGARVMLELPAVRRVADV
jgi:signal transduction histidine kinase